MIHKKLKRKIRQVYENTTFSKLLTITMVSIVTIAFSITGFFTIGVTEKKIHENVRNSMSIVLEQYENNLGNYITAIYNGFREVETDTQVKRLQQVDTSMKFLQIWANGHVYVNNLLKQYQEANATSISNVYMNFYNGLRVVQTYETDLLKINWNYDTWKERFPENRYYWVDTSSCKELVPDSEIGAIFFACTKMENVQVFYW